MKTFTTSDGWRMKYATSGTGSQAPDGGIVLTDVQHKEHYLAREIRAVGIRLGFDSYVKGKRQPRGRELFLPLNHATFKFGDIEVLDGLDEPRLPVTRPKPEFAPSSELGKALAAGGGSVNVQRTKKQAILDEFARFGNVYGYVKGLRMTYTSMEAFDVVQPSLVHPNYGKLRVTQTFLFTKYDKEPPHEPGGVLRAARIFPLIRFELIEPDATSASKEEHHLVKSARVDYRFHLSMDGPHRGTDDRPNLAGVFKDEEDLDWGAVVVWFLADRAKAYSRGVFKAGEKPLVKEIAAYGLFEGGNLVRRTGSKEPVCCWDNVHWLGGLRQGRHAVGAGGRLRNPSPLEMGEGGGRSALRRPTPVRGDHCIAFGRRRPPALGPHRSLSFGQSLELDPVGPVRGRPIRQGDRPGPRRLPELFVST